MPLESHSRQKRRWRVDWLMGPGWADISAAVGFFQLYSDICIERQHGSCRHCKPRISTKDGCAGREIESNRCTQRADPSMVNSVSRLDHGLKVRNSRYCLKPCFRSRLQVLLLFS